MKFSELEIGDDFTLGNRKEFSGYFQKRTKNIALDYDIIHDEYPIVVLQEDDEVSKIEVKIRWDWK